MKAHIIILVLLLVGCTAQPTGYYQGINDDDLFSLLEKQASERWYDEYLDNFILAHNHTWPDLSIKCWPEMTDAGLTGFHLITVINSSGKAVDVRTDIPDFSAQCFSSGVKKTSYPVPPKRHALIMIAVGLIGDE